MITIEEKYNWNKEQTPFTVEEIRKLSALHGMDITMIIGYNQKENIYSCITVGKNKEFADLAHDIGMKIMNCINPIQKNMEILEDRRSEHNN